MVSGVSDFFSNLSGSDLPPVVRPSLKFLHADTLSGANVRVSGAGGRYPSTITVIDTQAKVVVKTINLIEHYNPITGAITGPVGALPI